MQSYSEINKSIEVLAYGSVIKWHGLEDLLKCAYDHASVQRKNVQQENTSYSRIIYQSDGNFETVDHAEGHDQPRSFVSTNSKIRSKVLVFGQVNISSQVFMVLRAL